MSDVSISSSVVVYNGGLRRKAYESEVVQSLWTADNGSPGSSARECKTRRLVFMALKFPAMYKNC